MIPSRKRPDKLLRAIKSIVAATPDENYEMLFRFDEDDKETLDRREEIAAAANNPRIIVGSRLGYKALDSGYYAGLEQLAVGCFVWIAGDDMTVEGDWMNALRKAPLTGAIIQPATSKLGHSTYPRAEAQAFPLFPRLCWKQYVDEFPRPFDTAGDALLKKHGWITHFLEGVTFHHHEDTPHNLSIHRQ